VYFPTPRSRGFPKRNLACDENLLVSDLFLVFFSPPRGLSPFLPLPRPLRLRTAHFFFRSGSGTLLVLEACPEIFSRSFRWNRSRLMSRQPFFRKKLFLSLGQTSPGRSLFTWFDSFLPPFPSTGRCTFPPVIAGFQAPAALLGRPLSPLLRPFVLLFVHEIILRECGCA